MKLHLDDEKAYQILVQLLVLSLIISAIIIALLNYDSMQYCQKICECQGAEGFRYSIGYCECVRSPFIDTSITNK